MRCVCGGGVAAAQELCLSCLLHDPILSYMIWKPLLKGEISLDGTKRSKTINQSESQRGAGINSRLYVSVCAQACKFLPLLCFHDVV
jgi:hypothetical protein